MERSVLGHRFPLLEPLSQRDLLVKQTIKLLRSQNLVVVRAPPQSGKSILLKLVARQILLFHQDLEPVWISWTPLSLRVSHPILKNYLRYEDYLSYEYEEQRSLNEESRQAYADYLSDLYGKKNPTVKEDRQGTKQDLVKAKKTIVYLIDEAIFSYQEQIWEDLFQNEYEDRSRLFLMACEYGSATPSLVTYGSRPWQVANVEPEKRIELFKPDHGGGELALNSDEITELITHWKKGLCGNIRLEKEDLKDLGAYLTYQTQGHAGILSHMLEWFTRRAMGAAEKVAEIEIVSTIAPD